MQSARDAFEHRDFTTAEKGFSEGADEDGKNQLLFLLDRAITRHTAGNYTASNQDFLRADKLSEIKDYTALATELATIITNDRITEYKGEEFETVLISTYLALNYALLGKDEDAIVECKRVNRKLERLRSEGKRDYRLNAFAQYLSGILYERDRNWNNSYVDYRKTFEIDPKIPFLKEDLLRGALKIDSESELDKWRRQINVGDSDIAAAAQSLKSTGSVIVVWQNGIAPEKIVSRAWPELPEYRKRFNKDSTATVYVNGQKKTSTQVLYDVEDAAFKNLQQKYALYIAKRVAGVIGREVIGNQVAKTTNSDALGALAKITLFMASQPDLRSWLTLPANFQVARVQLVPGNYDISLHLSGQGSDQNKALGHVEIKKPGDVVLLNYRSLND